VRADWWTTASSVNVGTASEWLDRAWRALLPRSRDCASGMKTWVSEGHRSDSKGLRCCVWVDRLHRSSDGARSGFFFPTQIATMPPTNPIPRFLLPQRGAIWRTRLSPSSASSITIRNASHKAPKKSSKPLVLEKPAKFNPPSHGSRLRKEPPRYPGPQLSAEQQATQKTKQYPNMMPPEGTFMHWFVNNRSIHMYITLVRPMPLPISHKELMTSTEHTLHPSGDSVDHKLQTQLPFCRHAPPLDTSLHPPHCRHAYLYGSH
jgi:hypothetical protein